jgi:hypothetical protein
MPKTNVARAIQHRQNITTITNANAPELNQV